MATKDNRVGSYVGKETQKEIEGNEKDLYRYTTEKFRQKNPIYNPDSPSFKRSREHERKYLESAEDKDDRVRKLKVIAAQTDENVPIEKAKYRREQIPTNEALYGMKKGGKVKKYADGGMTQQPTYPFYGNQPQAGGQNGGTNQTFNMQPQATAGVPDQQQQTFKKGGSVKVKKMAFGGMGNRPAPARPMPAPAKPMPTPPGSIGSRIPSAQGNINNPLYKQQPSGSGAVKPNVPTSSAMSARPLSPKTFMKQGGKVSTASKRADGCAIRGKTRA